MPEKTRFEQRSVWALAAVDTFDPLAERIRGLLSHDRRMILISRYVNKTGADDLTILPGLRLDSDGIEPIEDKAWGGPRPGRSLFVHLAPGINAAGFGIDTRAESQMRGDWDARGERYDAPVTAVRIDGWPGTPSRDDLIEIEHWNEHRVGRLTTIAFQADWG